MVNKVNVYPQQHWNTDCDRNGCSFGLRRVHDTAGDGVGSRTGKGFGYGNTNIGQAMALGKGIQPFTISNMGVCYGYCSLEGKGKG